MKGGGKREDGVTDFIQKAFILNLWEISLKSQCRGEVNIGKIKRTIVGEKLIV